jgi:organic radical activating enzyme
MNVAGTQFTLQYNAFEIYLSGCDGTCVGCHNPELHDFNVGDNYLNVLPNILSTLYRFGNLIKWVWIMGGEPLLQSEEDLILLLKSISMVKPIMFFTRFNYVPDNIKEYCSYIKTGAYIDNLESKEEIITVGNNEYNITLASNNQNIIKLKEIDL